MASEYQTLVDIESRGHLNPAQRTQLEQMRASMGGQGSDSLDVSQIPSVQSFIQGQFGVENESVNDLITAMQGREDPLAMYSRLEEEAGIPMLRESSKTLSGQIAGIEDYLEQIEPDVSARTRESLVTEAQRRAMVAEGKRPWIEKLDKFGTALGRVRQGITDAMSGIGTKTELGLKGQEMRLEPLQLKHSMIVDRNARLLTGFTEDRETQLMVLKDKLDRRRQLSDREWELARELEAEEREYRRTLEQAAAESGVAYSGGSNDDLLKAIGLGSKPSLSDIWGD